MCLCMCISACVCMIFLGVHVYVCVCVLDLSSFSSFIVRKKGVWKRRTRFYLSDSQGV